MNIIQDNFEKILKIANKNKYSKILVKIIIDWKIPFFQLIKKYLVYVSIFSLVIFLYPKFFKDFWEYSFNLLIFILIISPLSKIFPRIKIFNKILILRRQIWIIIWSFLFAHFIWYILQNNIEIIKFLKQNLLNYSSFLFFGIWWFLFMLFPFLTSNNLSQKILKRKWIIFQKMTHWFFVFWILHIYFLKWDFSYILLLILWIILKILTTKKIVILK